MTFLRTLLNRIVVTQDNYLDTLGGTIDSTKAYFLDGVIDIGSNPINIPSGGVFILGYGFDISKLITSQTSFTMFTGATAGNIFLRSFSIEVNGSGSQVFEVTSNTGFDAIELNEINFDKCTSLGDINGYRQGLETNTGRFGGTPELTLSGNWVGGYFIDTSIVRSLTDGTYTLFKAGVGFTMASRFRSNQNIDLPTNASFFDFEPDNFTNPSTLQIDSAIVSRNGIFNASDTNITPNIDQTNLVSSWRGNVGIENTFEGGQLTLSTESTTSLTGGNWSTLAGSWTPSNLEHFDNPSEGQLRHLGNSPREYKCTVDFIIEGGGNDEIGIRLRKYDNSTASFIDLPERIRQINNFQGGRDVAIFNLSFNVKLDRNDYVFFQVRNNTDNTNVTLELDSDYTIEQR